MARSKLFEKLGRGKPGRRAAARELAPKEPRNERARYVARMLAFWKMWEGIVKAEFRVDSLQQQAVTIGMFSHGTIVDQRRRLDARLFEATFGQLFDHARLDRFISGIGNQIADKSERYMRDIVKIPTPVRGRNHMVDDFTDRNVKLIKGLGDDQITRLTELLRNSTAHGVRAEELAPEVGKILDAGESRLQLIARDQTLKFYAATNQSAQQSAGIESYIWVTSGDERVREDHAALDGQEFRYDDPPDTGNSFNNPGEDFQCRCVATPQIPLFAGI